METILFSGSDSDIRLTDSETAFKDFPKPDEYGGTRFSYCGETYKRCSYCGKWHTAEYGFSLKYDTSDGYCEGKFKLCAVCAKKFEPLLQQLSDMMFTARFQSVLGMSPTPEQLRERHSETLIEAVRREAAEADSE